MSDRSKKIFLAICIIVPFFLYCFYYYSIMVKNAPYRFSDFQKITLSYGDSEPLLNNFDSESGAFSYINTQDSLILDTIRMRKDDLLYLHRKATELGFWNLPEDMTSPNHAASEKKNTARYILTFSYKDKTKKVSFDSDFEGNPKMTGAARSVIEEVQRVISDARDRK